MSALTECQQVVGIGRVEWWSQYESGSDRVTGLAISTVAWVDTRSLPLPVLTPLIAIDVRAISCDFVDPFVQAERHGTRHHDNSQLLSVVFPMGTRTA